jgi:ATP-dependent helicase HrpA
MNGLALTVVDRLTPILQIRQQVVVRAGATAPTVLKPAAKVRTFSDLSQLGQLTSAAAVVQTPARGSSPFSTELATLLPANFLESVTFDRLTHYPRYLKALLTRIDRAAHNPVKEQERAAQVAPYVEMVRKLAAKENLPRDAQRLAEEFRWLVEEWKVSVFAQELGTAIPVSPKRLDDHLDQLRHAAGQSL